MYNDRLDLIIPRRLGIPQKHSDPFSNMVYKNSKSPTLKPVYIKHSRRILKNSKSEEKISGLGILPPISSKYPKKYFQPKMSDRLSIKTPNFPNNSTKNKQFNINNLSEHKNQDLSFGEVDEKIESINSIIVKYQ